MGLDFISTEELVWNLNLVLLSLIADDAILKEETLQYPNLLKITKVHHKSILVFYLDTEIS